MDMVTRQHQVPDRFEDRKPGSHIRLKKVLHIPIMRGLFQQLVMVKTG